MSIRYPIETPRLRLLPFTAADEDALYRLESDPEVKRFTGGVLTRQQTVHLLQSFITQVAQTGTGAVAIKQKVDDQIIGLCGLVPDADEAELFFGLARSAWQQGFATEACRGLIEAGFQQLQLTAISALVDPANVRSIHVLVRVGMRLRAQVGHDTTAATEITYGIDAHEWQSSA